MIPPPFPLIIERSTCERVGQEGGTPMDPSLIRFHLACYRAREEEARAARELRDRIRDSFILVLQGLPKVW